MSSVTRTMSEHQRQMLTTPITKLLAERLHVVTLDVSVKGNTVEFLDAIYSTYRQAMTNLMNIIKTAESKRAITTTPWEVMFAVHEIDMGVWTGVGDQHQTLVLRHKDQTWTIKPSKAIHVDGHGNMHTYVRSVIRDETMPTRCRFGWVLTEARVLHKYPRVDMYDDSRRAMTHLADILEGKYALGERVENSIAVLNDQAVVEFADVLRQWVASYGSHGGKFPVAFLEFKSLNLAGYAWFDLLDLLYYRVPIGDPTRFACDVMVQLLLLVENVDQKLYRMMTSKLRRKMNSAANPQNVGTDRTVYTYGADIFDKVASIRKERKLKAGALA